MIDKLSHSKAHFIIVDNRTDETKITWLIDQANKLLIEIF